MIWSLRIRSQQHQEQLKRIIPDQPVPLSPNLQMIFRLILFLINLVTSFEMNESKKLSIKVNKLLGDWFARKNSRRLNSIYNVYWLLTRFRFVQLPTQLFPSNLEVHFTSTLSWTARNINIALAQQYSVLYNIFVHEEA